MPHFAVGRQQWRFDRDHLHSGIAASVAGSLGLFLAMTALCPQVHAQQNHPVVGNSSTTSSTIATGSAGSDALPLSMHQAVQLGLKQNPRLLASRLEALQSKQTTKVARSV